MIDVNQRGKGISKELMYHLESIAQIKGAKKIRLTVISKKVSSWRSIPHSYIPIVSFPQEITMVFVKSIQK